MIEHLLVGGFKHFVSPKCIYKQLVGWQASFAWRGCSTTNRFTSVVNHSVLVDQRSVRMMVYDQQQRCGEMTYSCLDWLSSTHICLLLVVVIPKSLDQYQIYQTWIKHGWTSEQKQIWMFTRVNWNIDHESDHSHYRRSWVMQDYQHDMLDHHHWPINQLILQIVSSPWITY